MTVPAEELSKLVLDNISESCIKAQDATGVAMASNKETEQVECHGQVRNKRREPTTEKGHQRDDSGSPQMEAPDVEISEVDNQNPTESLHVRHHGSWGLFPKAAVRRHSYELRCGGNAHPGEPGRKAGEPRLREADHVPFQGVSPEVRVADGRKRRIAR